MDVTPLIKTGTPVIQSYKNGVFRVLNQNFPHAIIISPNGVSEWDGSLENLPPHDVLILGTGEKQIWPDAKTRAQSPMEVMTTPAACRTYNALISEGRDVLALLAPHAAPR